MRGESPTAYWLSLLPLLLLETIETNITVFGVYFPHMALIVRWKKIKAKQSGGSRTFLGASGLCLVKSVRKQL